MNSFTRKYLEWLCKFEVTALDNFSLFLETVRVASGPPKLKMPERLKFWF